MAGVKLQLQPRHARLFDTHAKGEPRQRIAHLYQTIRMRPAIFGKYVKDMDNVKPACAVIFRGYVPFLVSEAKAASKTARWTSSIRRQVRDCKFNISHDKLALDTIYRLS